MGMLLNAVRAALAAVIIDLVIDLDKEEEDTEYEEEEDSGDEEEDSEEEMESSNYESEEDITPPATPPLINGDIASHQERLMNRDHNLTLAHIQQELAKARALVADLSNQHDKLVEQMSQDKCRKCGTQNGTHVISCKNKSCDVFFKKSGEKRKASTEVCKINAGTSAQMSQDDKHTPFLDDHGRATMRGVRKCRKCGTQNGTHVISCKNIFCDVIFKEAGENRKTSTVACKITAGTSAQVNVEAWEQNRVILPHLAAHTSSLSTSYAVSSLSSLPVKQEYSPLKEEEIDIIEEMDNSLEVMVEAREQNRLLLPHLAASASTVSTPYTDSSFSSLPIKQEYSLLKEEKIDIIEEMDNSLEMKISSTSHNSYFMDSVVKEEPIDPENYHM